MASPYNEGSQSIQKAEHISPNKTGDNIEAKRVANYAWNGGLGQWQRDDGSGAVYATIIDDTTTANTTYIGKAAIGSATSSAVWQIAKLDTTSGIIKTWADGDANFDNIWDNIASLSYS